ncbi:PfkB family carbohydrate kinase [Nocardioides sp. CER19]|uniref:PfkB family carbohydrate kinase n=1 Tax=Nocardioides sp. CER19 TaxID=3038538 RepID=UPI00244846D6|nr:PfkB family carbohydrate kinase [Nocardioides sp. CER19]MDH2414551.1 PfkB family carbohydrate kinase [Nocardioides sp. CER19]
MDATGTAVVIGEALIDVVVTPDGRVAEASGGSPLNVAVTLGRLGVATTLVTALGEDPRGERIAEHVAASGVALAAGAHTLDATSTAVARLGADGAATYDFDIHWHVPDRPLPPATVVHAGSLGLFLPPGADVVRARLAQAAEQSLVTLDPNARPTIVPDAAATTETFEELCGHAHVVKLSDEDAAWLYPGLTLEAVVTRLLGLGLGLVGVTRGSAGVLLASGDEVVTVAAPAVRVADTIGAGDSFMGALVQQLIARELTGGLRDGRALTAAQLADVGAFAASVAAVTVSRHGADPPWLHELALG